MVKEKQAQQGLFELELLILHKREQQKATQTYTPPL